MSQKIGYSEEKEYKKEKRVISIESIDYTEGRLKAVGQLDIERYARKNGTWKIHYTPSAILSEIQNVPWDVDGNVSIMIHLPEKARFLKGMEDSEISGEGYFLNLKNVVENKGIKISIQVSKRKGVFIPQDVIDNLLLDLEYEVTE